MAKKPKAEYLLANERFLEELKSQTDIIQHPSGVLYRIIESGDDSSKSPEDRSVVSVHYRGRLINGREFDSTYKNSYPETFRLRELIDGWQIALKLMHAGDKWEIFIPAALGYGDRASGNIPGGSTLIFELQLLAIN